MQSPARDRLGRAPMSAAGAPAIPRRAGSWDKPPPQQRLLLGRVLVAADLAPRPFLSAHSAGAFSQVATRSDSRTGKGNDDIRNHDIAHRFRRQQHMTGFLRTKGDGAIASRPVAALLRLRFLAGIAHNAARHNRPRSR